MSGFKVSTILPSVTQTEQLNKRRKQKIPIALREAVWLRHMGKTFDGKCYIPWCKNRITVFDFQSGHDVPESKGGLTILENLYPLCSRCNLSMGDRFTIKEWCALSRPAVVPVAVPVVNTKKWSCYCF